MIRPNLLPFRVAHSPWDLARLRGAMSEVPGISMSTSRRDQLRLNGRLVRFGIEADGLLELSCKLDSLPPAWDALALHATLPGSLRYVQSCRGPYLLAESELSGRPNLERLMRSLDEAAGKNGAGQLTRSAVAREITRPPAPAMVRELLARSELPPDDIVHMDTGWELRTRIRGEKVAVQLTPVQGGLRLWRTVLTQVRRGVCRRAVASQALRLNAQVRRTRLMRSGDAVRAEVLLDAGVTDGPGLARSTRAVATAFLHCRPVLELLNREPQIAAHYEKLLCRS